MNVLFGRPEEPRSPRPIHWAEGILLAAGLICFCWFGYNWLASQADQIWSNYQLDASLAGEKPTVTGFLHRITHAPEKSEKTAAKAVPEAPKEAPPHRDVPVGENIGRIEIPRLNISAIVRQGVDNKVLGRAVGHVPSTALPGESGNVGLAAHRDTYFRNLRDVKEGDVIRMITPEGNWEYVVESLQIVHPTNVEVLDPTPNPSMTLVTCYPFNYVGHAPKRFIVRARQLGSHEGAPSTAAAPSSSTAHGPVRRHSRRRS